ncbi:hypothetical protein GCM10028803_41320 [Larkinella knui]|uniref:Uncharacterized protein n=1 Tax=Larkinella knui TaxID=2025310 RepID=A0A3P1CN54_9BACT|nr:hypothetical protein [Larkinella knui]RRB14763.1 hypothetical protein EHT87_09340 [Larkinella knui]
MRSGHKVGLLNAVFILLLLLPAHRKQDRIRYFNAPTIPLKPDTVQAFVSHFKDDAGNDTLFQTRSKEGYPVSYFRKIKTSVCFDNKCRLLDIVLYWNVTGRYLGFELPEGEFLSKTEHEPFKPEEYGRLNELLADPFSPLANFSYEELVPKADLAASGLDAVSSATSKNVLDYVVEGAVYTTYKMWHFVYGATQKEVVSLTEKRLSPGFVLKILESPDSGDKIWALNHIRGRVELTSGLRNTLLSFIDNNRFNLAERAINALSPDELKSDSLQLRLFEKFPQTNYALKNLIVTKFKEAPHLNPQVKTALARALKSANGELLSNILDLFKLHRVTDRETGRIIADLLQSPNNFLSQKAFIYLKSANIDDKTVVKQLNDYKAKHTL